MDAAGHSNKEEGLDAVGSSIVKEIMGAAVPSKEEEVNVLYTEVLYCTALYCAMLFCVVLCCAVL